MTARHDALLACPRMRAAVAEDSARNRARLLGTVPARISGPWRAVRAGALVALCLMLAGCRWTIWSVEWDTRGPAFDNCEHDRPTCTAYHNPAGGYIPACGDLPGQLGDDC